MVTITWNDGVTPAQTFSLTDNALAALEQFRLTVTKYDEPSKSMVPIYATLPDLCRGFLNQSAIRPALSAFPPAAVLAARQAVVDAQAAHDAALELAITGAITGDV